MSRPAFLVSPYSHILAPRRSAGSAIVPQAAQPRRSFGVALALAVALAGSFAAGRACAGPMELTTGYVSRHLGGAEALNEANGGLGLELPSGAETVRFGVGFYRNSYDRASAYLGAAWRPLRVGPATFGVLAGAATGYANAPVVPMAGLSIDAGPAKGPRVHVLLMPPSPIAPAVLALQLKATF